MESQTPPYFLKFCLLQQSQSHSHLSPLMMEKAVLLRSISSCTSHACIRSFTRRLSTNRRRLSTNRRRLIPNLHRPSPLRRYLRHISTALPSRLNFSTRFSHIIPKAIATSSPQYSQDAISAHDDVAEKLGFEKVSEQFIEECKSTAVLYKHKNRL